MAADHYAGMSQRSFHLSATVKRICCEQLVDFAHQIERLGTLANRAIVDGRSADVEKFALPANADSGFAGLPLDHGFALIPIRWSPSAKKSRSIVNCPILA